MSSHRRSDTGNGADPLAELLSRAGARPEVDALRKARVERAVRGAWQQAVRRRRRQRWGLSLAAGLAVVAALFALRLPPSAPASVDVAVVVHLHGQVHVEAADGLRALSVGDRLRSGARLVTAAQSSIALSLERIASVRVDQSSQVQLVDPRRIELGRGGIYLDSGAAAGGIVVATPLLQAGDIGTRFMLRHDDIAGSVVAVRDGRVEVEADGRHALAGGERLQRGTGGAATRSRLPPSAAEWDWARAAGAPLAVEGRPLRALVEWYAHESGMTLQVAADDALRQRLQSPLMGDVAGLGADELLTVAAVAGAFTTRVDRERGVLHVDP